jgi:hypothetical protein
MLYRVPLFKTFRPQTAFNLGVKLNKNLPKGRVLSFSSKPDNSSAMARSWASVVRSGLPVAPAPAPAVSVLRAEAPEWKPPSPCCDCGAKPRLCANGCPLPGNRRRRVGWVCAPCDHAEDRRISQMPYMDIGPLADPDYERKEQFRCESCHKKKSDAEEALRQAEYAERVRKEKALEPARLAAEAASEAIYTAYFKAVDAELAYAKTLGGHAYYRVLERAHSHLRRYKMTQDAKAAYDRVFAEEKARLGL